MQQQVHMQSHARTMEHHQASGQPPPPPPRLLSIQSAQQTHHNQSQQNPPTPLPNMHQSQIHPNHSSMTPQRASIQKMQNPMPNPTMSQQNQHNGHYSHPHQNQQQNGEIRPSVIESNQPLIIECT